MNKDTYTISIYPADFPGGFRYTVNTRDQALNHLGAIIQGGYRRIDDRGNLVWIPPHRLMAVKVAGPGLETQYPDETFRT